MIQTILGTNLRKQVNFHNLYSLSATAVILIFCPGDRNQKVDLSKHILLFNKNRKTAQCQWNIFANPNRSIFQRKKYINILLRLSSQKYMFCLGDMQLNVGLFVCQLFRDQRNVPEQFLFDRKVIIVQKHKQVR